MQIRVCLKCFVGLFLLKKFVDSNSPQKTSTLIASTVLVTLKLFIQLEQLSGKEPLKQGLLGNYFSDPLIEVEYWY